MQLFVWMGLHQEFSVVHVCWQISSISYGFRDILDRKRPTNAEFQNLNLNKCSFNIKAVCCKMVIFMVFLVDQPKYSGFSIYYCVKQNCIQTYKYTLVQLFLRYGCIMLCKTDKTYMNISFYTTKNIFIVIIFLKDIWLKKIYKKF
jgi:hypothetical protein